MWSVTMEEPDSDPDQYQDELSDAVDDGGGCAETWEKLSEARRKSSLDRRSVLKGVGAFGAAALGVSGIGAATAKKKPDDEEIDEALNSEGVQALLDELENPEIRRNATRRIEPKIQGADEVDDLDEDELISILILPTKAGDIVYPLIEEEDLPVIFRFKGKGTRPDKYEDLPEGVSSGLIARGDEITVVRGATKHEKDVLLEVTQFDTDEADPKIIKTSEINGFRLFKGFEDAPDRAPEDDPEIDPDLEIFDLLLEDRDIQDEVQELFEEDLPNPEDVEVEEVFTAQQSCLSICTQCIAIIGGACPACLPFLAFGVAGAVAFILCFTSVCGIALPITCGLCLDCGT